MKSLPNTPFWLIPPIRWSRRDHGPDHTGNVSSKLSGRSTSGLPSRPAVDNEMIRSKEVLHVEGLKMTSEYEAPTTT